MSIEIESYGIRAGSNRNVIVAYAVRIPIDRTVSIQEYGLPYHQRISRVGIIRVPTAKAAGVLTV